MSEFDPTGHELRSYQPTTMPSLIFRPSMVRWIKKSMQVHASDMKLPEKIERSSEGHKQ